MKYFMVVLVFIISLTSLNAKDAIIIKPFDRLSLSEQKEKIENNFKIIGEMMSNLDSIINNIDYMKKQMAKIREFDKITKVCRNFNAIKIGIMSIESKMKKISDHESKYYIDYNKRLVDHKKALADLKSLNSCAGR